METIPLSSFRTALPYWRVAQAEIARLLSWQDREPFSKTYGCFDRTFWSWKFTDFPGARFQEGVYALAYLFCRAFPDNPFATDQRALDWARAGMRFWQHIQYSDGSLDEAYPFEHSLAATAFASFYVGEAFLLLRNYVPSDEQDGLRLTLVRAADWLCRNDEYHGVLSNHLAAAAAALIVAFQISGETRYEQRSRYFLQRIYDHQSDEGWYEEYGGADPGYQTHATFYLARVWQRTADTILLDSLARSLTFLKHFIHPNGTLGGEYGSRNTEFYFPAGFEILASTLPEAAQIARFMRPSVAEQRGAGLQAMDVYNFLPMLNNYLFAAENATDCDGGDEDLPCQREGEWLFSDAGLLVKSTPVYYCVFGLSKGGVLKIYDRATRRLALSDCGYFAILADKRVISSQSLNRGQGWRRDEGGFIVETDFVQVNQRVQTPWLFIAFRLFSLTLGKVQSAACWLKDLLVRVLVRRRRSAPIHLFRRVHFAVDRVCISDEIALAGKLQVEAVQRGSKFATVHMGSSRYFQVQELEAQPDRAQDWVRELMQRRRLRIDRSWDPAMGRKVCDT